MIPPVDYPKAVPLGHYVIASHGDPTLIGQQRWVWKVLASGHELIVATDARGVQRNSWPVSRWYDGVAAWGVFVPVPQCPRRRQPQDSRRRSEA